MRIIHLAAQAPTWEIPLIILLTVLGAGSSP